MPAGNEAVVTALAVPCPLSVLRYGMMVTRAGNMAMNPVRVIASHRLFLGALLGIAAWLVFGLAFGEPGSFTAAISMLLAMWVSAVWEPKRTLSLAALIGFPAGVFHAVQYLVQLGAPLSVVDAIGHFIGALISVPLIVLIITASYVLEGLVFSGVAQLYKRKAIF